MDTEVYLSADAWVVIRDRAGAPRQRQHAVLISMDSKGNRLYRFPCGMGERTAVDKFGRLPLDGHQICGQAWCKHRYADHDKFKDDIEARIAEDEAEIAVKMRAARGALIKLERRLVRQ